MDAQIVSLPPLNERILQAIMETCLDSLLESPQGLALVELNNVATANLEGKVGKETFEKIESLVPDAAWFYGMEMFKMGLAIGLQPSNIFKLPDMSW